MTNTLFIRLEGPMQSWGERARWSVRDTAPEPTKSGVVGLLACALGLSADEELRELSGQVSFGVRCDRPGSILVDFHTVVGGVMSAQGKVKVNATTHQPETVVSYRYYLCDASFLAAVRSAPDVIARLAEAVQRPHWPVYLGRKSCPPSRPIYEGTGGYPSLLAALEAQPLQSHTPDTGEAAPVRAVIECSPSEGVRRRDEVLSRSRRTFASRYTRDVYLTLPIQAQEV